MIKKIKQKVYYDDERIESVFCDKCKKELTEDDDFYIFRVDKCYYEKGDRCLKDLDEGCSKLLCEDCGKPIEELLE